MARLYWVCQGNGLSTWPVRFRLRWCFSPRAQGIPDYWTDDSAIADEVLSGAFPMCAGQSESGPPVSASQPRLFAAYFAVWPWWLQTRMHSAIPVPGGWHAGLSALAYEFKLEELFEQLGMADLSLSIKSISSGTGKKKPLIHAMKILKLWSSNLPQSYWASTIWSVLCIGRLPDLSQPEWLVVLANDWLYKNRVVNALAISGGGRLVIQLVSLFIPIALARLLTPWRLWPYRDVLVFTGFAELLADVGLGSALIQKKDATELHYSTVLLDQSGARDWFHRGIFISALIWLPLFTSARSCRWLRKFLSLQFVLCGSPFGFLVSAWLKNYVLATLSFANFAGMLLAGGLALFMAVNWLWILGGGGGFGMAGGGSNAGLQLWLSAWLSDGDRNLCSVSPRSGSYSASAFMYLALEPYSMAPAQLISFWLVKYLGGEAVGLLGRAQTLIYFFRSGTFPHVVGKVMFPALSMVQDDITRVRKGVPWGVRRHCPGDFPNDVWEWWLSQTTLWSAFLGWTVGGDDSDYPHSLYCGYCPLR